MSLIGNIIWLFLGGFLNGLLWLFWGVVWSVTIIGLPVGLQCFKLARLQFSPFGKEVIQVNYSGGTFLMNVLWLLSGGWSLALGNLVSAFALAITIVGIPFAIQSLKLAQLSLMPFGKEVVRRRWL